MKSDPSDDANSESAGWRGALQRYGPWLAAIGIFGWIFESVSFAEAWDAARNADLLNFGGAVALGIAWWFLVDSACLAYLFSSLNAPVSWAEARSLRALSYLVTPINWNAGSAAMILHLRQSKNIGVVSASSSMLFFTLIDIGVMTCLLGSAIWLRPGDLGLATAGRGMLAVMTLNIGILAIAMTDLGSARWLAKLRSLGILQSWRRVRLRHIGVLLSMRVTYFAAFVFLYWWGAGAFGVDVPLSYAAASMPIIQASAALPITPGGLGTQQAVMLEFFRPYGTESAILAFAVAFPVAVIVGRLGVGLFYIRDLAEFRRVRAEAKAAAGIVP